MFYLIMLNIFYLFFKKKDMPDTLRIFEAGPSAGWAFGNWDVLGDRRPHFDGGDDDHAPGL